MKNIKQKKCKNCKGSGLVPIRDMEGNLYRGLEKCPVCKGTGVQNNEETK